VSEEQLRGLLSAQGLARTPGEVSVTTWSNGPGATYAAHRHGYDKVLLVDAGSIRFTLPELARDVDLAAGERLDLPAGTLHSAAVGAVEVSCVEAHLAAGTLPPETAAVSRS
jgi:quercetin dioxygenase-like cupin family protein